MNEPCRKNMCHKCAKNFNKLTDNIFSLMYPKEAKIKHTFERYTMRNDSCKLTKIIQKLLNLNDLANYSDEKTIVFPNKYIDYTVSDLENRVIGREGFRFNNSLSRGDVSVQLSTIIRTALCGDCYKKWKHDIEFLDQLAKLYYRCSYVYKMFDVLIKKPYLIEHLDSKTRKGKSLFSDVVKNKLLTFHLEAYKMISPDWKGSDYYFRKIFGVPLFLSGIVPREHFEKFHNGYISDVIAGHPMASNGWMQEAIDDMEERGCFA